VLYIGRQLQSASAIRVPPVPVQAQSATLCTNAAQTSGDAAKSKRGALTPSPPARRTWRSVQLPAVATPTRWLICCQGGAGWQPPSSRLAPAASAGCLYAPRPARAGTQPQRLRLLPAGGGRHHSTATRHALTDAGCHARRRHRTSSKRCRRRGSTLGCSGTARTCQGVQDAIVVDVCIAQRAPRHGVAAHADGGHGANLRARRAASGAIHIWQGQRLPWDRPAPARKSRTAAPP